MASSFNDLEREVSLWLYEHLPPAGVSFVLTLSIALAFCVGAGIIFWFVVKSPLWIFVSGMVTIVFCTGWMLVHSIIQPVIDQFKEE